jgi:tetratricopeptide (TPR) repeat protein
MNKRRIIGIVIAIIAITFVITIGYQQFFTDLAMGKRYLNYFNYVGAINKFQDVLNKDPNNIEAHLYLSLAYGKRRNYQGFLKEIRWVEDKGVKPKLSAQVYNDIGMIYYLLEMYPQAILKFKNAAEVNPRFADAYFNLAAAFSANTQKAEAAAAYKKVLELDPRNVYAHRELALLLEDTGNIEAAIAHWEKYIEFVPGIFRNPEVDRHLQELQDLLSKKKRQSSK